MEKKTQMPEMAMYLFYTAPELVEEGRECLLYFAHDNYFSIGWRGENMWEFNDGMGQPLDAPDAVYILPEKHYKDLGLKDSAERYLISPEFTGQKGEA